MTTTELSLGFASVAVVCWGAIKLKALWHQSLQSFQEPAFVQQKINLYYCQVDDDDDHFPLAIARFTAYDEDHKPLSVEQVTYESDPNYFQAQVSAALSCGVDVSVITASPMEDFAWINQLSQQA
jgi:hypothetical protein